MKPEDPNYDIKELAVECATKRMYPDVLMYDKIKELTGSLKHQWVVVIYAKVGRMKMVKKLTLDG